MALEIPSAIAENGWQFYTKCTCGGSLKYKYRNDNKPGYELHWLVRARQFKLLLNAKLIVSLKPISELDSTLKSL